MYLRNSEVNEYMADLESIKMEAKELKDKLQHYFEQSLNVSRDQSTHTTIDDNMWSNLETKLFEVQNYVFICKDRLQTCIDRGLDKGRVQCVYREFNALSDSMSGHNGLRSQMIQNGLEGTSFWNLHEETHLAQATFHTHVGNWAHVHIFKTTNPYFVMM